MTEETKGDRGEGENKGKKKTRVTERGKQGWWDSKDDRREQGNRELEWQRKAMWQVIEQSKVDRLGQKRAKVTEESQNDWEHGWQERKGDRENNCDRGEQGWQ